MDQRDRKIYEELLADTRFVLWASGRNEEDDVYWKQWQKTHPGRLKQFNDACRTVSMLTFKSPDISSGEISERWKQSKKRMTVRLVRREPSGIMFWYRRMAGILIPPLLILFLYFFYSQRQLRSDFNQVIGYNGEKTVRVTAPLGGQLEIDLPDGSKAWLNSGSEINYPAFFNDKEREVAMTGEVYFQVSKSDKAFVVKNPGPTVRVHGTEFNIHAYSDEKEVTVALAKGRISLDTNGEELMMKPGEVATFDKASGHLTKQESDIYPYICWREGKYIFRNTPLLSILKSLERRYNVSIELDDPALGQLKYDATINGEPLEQILELLTFSAPLKYEFKRQQLKTDGSYSKAKVRMWRDTSKVLNPKK